MKDGSQETPGSGYWLVGAFEGLRENKEYKLEFSGRILADDQVQLFFRIKHNGGTFSSWLPLYNV